MNLYRKKKKKPKKGSPEAKREETPPEAKRGETPPETTPETQPQSESTLETHSEKEGGVSLSEQADDNELWDNVSSASYSHTIHIIYIKWVYCYQCLVY